VKRRRQAQVPPIRTAEQPTARQQRQTLKDGIAHAAKELRVAQDELSEIDSFVFVCMVALRAKTEDDVSLGVAAVLDVAYDKLALGVNENIRNAIEALGQDGGQ
jgi:hypothetical protein